MMSDPSLTLINPQDSLERQNEKLLVIASDLMGRVEQDTNRAGDAFAEFERAVILEKEVRDRTVDLEHALDLLNQSNARLAEASREAESARAHLTNAIETIREGFALFDDEDRLVLANRRYAMPLADIHKSVKPGLLFGDYVDLVAGSRFLKRADAESPQDWAAKRMARHREQHFMFNVHLLGDRWMQVSEHRTPDGGTAVLQTDVTEMMRLEREERGKLLDDQAQMICVTLDQINQGVCIFDPGGRLMGWNSRLVDMITVPPQLLRLGVGCGTLLDRVSMEFTPTENGLEKATVRSWVRRSTPRHPLSFEIRNSAGTVSSVFARDMPNGGFVICFTDVTSEREAARTLEEANELLERRVFDRTLELEDAVAEAERANASKTRFVAAASNDLLQPLSAAKLYLAAISEGDGRTHDRDAAGKALGALQSVEGIIEALLDISKLEQNDNLTVEKLSLHALLSGLRDEFAPIAALKGLRFRVVPSDITVASDPGYLRRILQNLIANAMRYTDEGTVLVGARRQGPSVQLEVWDTGRGIPAEDQDRIFREFERLDAATTAAEGLGLGLAIADRACARLGHPLSMRSELGQGSTFMVRVPRADSAPKGRLDLSSGRLSPSLGKSLPPGMVVLLVENDPELRLATTLLLEAWGLAVLDACNGQQAEQLLDELQFTPDAMLIDQHLGAPPDGLRLVRKLKQIHGDVPCRIVTADRSQDFSTEAMINGEIVLGKPIDARQLYEFLREAGVNMLRTTTLGL